MPEQSQVHHSMFLDTVQMLILEHPKLAGLVLIVAKIIGALILFPGTPLTLLAGATFGVFYGTIISLIGNTLGAVAAFFVARYLLRGYVTKQILMKYKTIETYEERFFSHGLTTVIFLRLIPLFPFNALNFILGVTRVSAKDYIIGTAIGIIPGTVAFVYFGQALRMLSVVHIALSVVAIGGLIYVGKYYKRKEQ